MLGIVETSSKELQAEGFYSTKSLTMGEQPVLFVREGRQEEEHEVHLKNNSRTYSMSREVYAKFSKCGFWLRKLVPGHVVNEDCKASDSICVKDTLKIHENYYTTRAWNLGSGGHIRSGKEFGKKNYCAKAVDRAFSDYDMRDQSNPRARQILQILEAQSEASKDSQSPVNSLTKRIRKTLEHRSWMGGNLLAFDRIWIPSLEICLTCSKIKENTKKTSGLLQQPEISLEWKMGNQMTKSAHFPTTSLRTTITEGNWAKDLCQEIVARHGVRCKFISDRVGSLTSHLWQSFQEDWVYKTRSSSAYHPPTRQRSVTFRRWRICFELCMGFCKLSPPYTPQHNGVSERRNYTSLDMVRSMMNLTTLPLAFLDYALESAIRILNMVPTKKVDKTPYELWYEKFPNLSYLKVWGCEALVKRDTPDKLQQISVKYAKFFEKNLITQEVSRRAIDLEEIQDEDTSPSEITSEIPMEVEGFKPPQEEESSCLVGVDKVKRSEYLRNTKDMFLVYGGNSKAELRVDCYCDAGFETAIDDTKSQT
ncbi:retrotransposon protein, putative, ty1-copia subclass [Tanacetum coccineum]